MRAELAEAVAEVIAEVGLPAVRAEAWPAALRANADTIRAALYSAEALFAMAQGGFAVVGLLREDGRGLSADRQKKGWIVRLGDTGKRWDCFASRPGSKHIGSRVKMSRLRDFLFFLFNRYDRFDWQEVEEMMLQFISTPGNPRSAHWIGLDWT